METPHRVEIRRVRATDAAAMSCFVEGLGATARRWRFHGSVSGCSGRLAALLTEADGLRHVAWVACATTDDGRELIVGEARYAVDADEADVAELAISVADAWCGRGIADRLMQALMQAARDAGLRRLRADVMADNARMEGLLQRHGFALGMDTGLLLDGARDDPLRFERTLRPRPPATGRLSALGSLVRRLGVRFRTPSPLRRVPAR